MKKIIYLLVFVFAICNLTAQSWYSKGIKGEGPVVSKTIDLEPIHSIGLGISGNVYVTQGNTQSIKIEGQQNIIDNIETKVKNGSWSIRFDRDVKNYDRVKIYVTMPNVNNLSIGGSGDIISEGMFRNQGDVSLSIGGSGDIEFEVEGEDVKASIGGSGEITLEGSGDALSISIAGSGDVIAHEFPVEHCKVSTAGSGSCKVNASETLNVSTVGSGDVYYKGKPSVKTSSVGSGSVSPL